MSDSKLMTVGQSAEHMNVSPATVRRIINRCEIRCSRIGRSLRLRQGDVEAFIANAAIGVASHGKAAEGIESRHAPGTAEGGDHEADTR